MKDNFLLKKNQREVFESLTDEDAGKLIKGIFRYVDTNDSQLIGALKAIFIPIKNDIDKNEKEYQKKCERNKLNGLKGGRPKKENQEEETQENPVGYFGKNPHISHIINNHLEEKKDNKGVIGEKEEKKETFGEFKNVLLTKKEYESLQKAHSNYEELIKFFDEYIQEKDYNSKNHYLTIKRWVVRAVEERSKDKQVKVTVNTPIKTEKELPDWFGKKLENEKMSEEEQRELKEFLEGVNTK